MVYYLPIIYGVIWYDVIRIVINSYLVYFRISSFEELEFFMSQVLKFPFLKFDCTLFCVFLCAVKNVEEWVAKNEPSFCCYISL